MFQHTHTKIRRLPLSLISARWWPTIPTLQRCSPAADFSLTHPLYNRATCCSRAFSFFCVFPHPFRSQKGQAGRDFVPRRLANFNGESICTRNNQAHFQHLCCLKVRLQQIVIAQISLSQCRQQCVRGKYIILAVVAFFREKH